MDVQNLSKTQEIKTQIKKKQFYRKEYTLFGDKTFERKLIRECMCFLSAVKINLEDPCEASSGLSNYKMYIIVIE